MYLYETHQTKNQHSSYLVIRLYISFGHGDRVRMYKNTYESINVCLYVPKKPYDNLKKLGFKISAGVSEYLINKEKELTDTQPKKEQKQPTDNKKEIIIEMLKRNKDDKHFESMLIINSRKLVMESEDLRRLVLMW